MSRRIILVDIGAGLTLRGVLPSVALFATYSATLKATGGQPPYTYTLSAGALPAGLYLDSATGVISGTANTAGVASFTVRATDLPGAYVDRAFSISVIAEPLSLSGAAPAWTVGTPYSYSYIAANGVPPYTWSLAAGALPAGLALDAGTGTISGTPTAPNAPAWTVRVTDSAGTSIDLRDNVTLQLAGTFADASVGTAYGSDLAINGGDLPYSNPRVTVGTLPAGLALSIVGDKLRLSGTPTAAGTSNFTVAVDSSDGQTAASAQSVVVSAGSMVSGLHFDGSNGSTTFTDVKGKVWTPLGAATITTAQSKFGGASGNFTGNGAISAAYDADFDLLDGSAFTLVGWARQTTTGDRRIFALSGSAVAWNATTGIHLLLQVDSGQRYTVGVSNGTGAPISFNSGSIHNVTNAWEHVELNCDGIGAGKILRLYVNGAKVADFDASTIVRPSGNPTPCYGRITAQGTGNDWIGQLDDWQILKGVALHTGVSFTPPTAPFTP